MNHQSILCEVENCMYFSQNKCTAQSIKVCKDCECVSESCDTNCRTFQLK